MSDYIEREKVLKLVAESGKFSLMAMIADPEIIPSADVRENIHGEWELDESDNSVTCNKCGCSMYLNDICNGDGHFCPNCGADMRGENGM